MGEHKKNARRSTKDKHEKAEARRTKVQKKFLKPGQGKRKKRRGNGKKE